MAHYPTPPKSAYSVKGLCGACESETLDLGKPLTREDEYKEGLEFEEKKHLKRDNNAR